LKLGAAIDTKKLAIKSPSENVKKNGKIRFINPLQHILLNPLKLKIITCFYAVRQLSVSDFCRLPRAVPENMTGFRAKWLNRLFSTLYRLRPAEPSAQNSSRLLSRLL